MKLILGVLLLSASHHFPPKQSTPKIFKADTHSIHDTLPANRDTSLEDGRFYTSLQIEASYKGGEDAWKKMVDSTLKANDKILNEDRVHSESTCAI